MVRMTGCCSNGIRASEVEVVLVLCACWQCHMATDSRWPCTLLLFCSFGAIAHEVWTPATQSLGAYFYTLNVSRSDRWLYIWGRCRVVICLDNNFHSLIPTLVLLISIDMFLVDSTKKAFDSLLDLVRTVSHHTFNVALVIVLLIEGAIEFSEQAASDLNLLMKVIRSNSIN